MISLFFTVLLYALLFHRPIFSQQDFNYYANYSTRSQLENLQPTSSVGLAKHGWELVFMGDKSNPVVGQVETTTYWRSCDNEVDRHHSELKTDWIPAISTSPSASEYSSSFNDEPNKRYSTTPIKPKLRLTYTTWCGNSDLKENCNGESLKIKVESKKQGDSLGGSDGDGISESELEIKISSRHRMPVEDNYFRPQTNDLPLIEGDVFRISIYDDNLCIKISSIQIFSYVCKEEVVDLALFSKTIAPFDGKRTEVLGQCVSNAADEKIRLGSATPGSSRTCTSFGSWQDTFSLCKCLPGFQPNYLRTQCEACPADYYKEVFGNSECVKCPQHSESFPGQSKCRCRPMFYKESNEPASLSCATTPSMPRELKAIKIGASFVRLSWLPPHNDGGRKEIKYIIQCDECYPPREYNTFWTNYTVLNLIPNKLYTFTVYATNSVSRFFHDISNNQFSVKTTKEVSPTNLRFVTSGSHVQEPNTVRLAWDRPNDYSGSSYCVEMKSMSQPEQSVMTYCINGTTFVRSGLEEGQYSFRVAPKFYDGSRGAYSATISGTISGNVGRRAEVDMTQLIAVMAIIFTISVLILILCLGMACLYKKHHVTSSTYEQQRSNFANCNTISPNNQSYAYGALTKVPIGQTFVEPNFYGEPEMMFAEFVKEIPENWVVVESQIAALGDESLWCGKLLLPNQPPFDVSVKTITHEFSSPGSLSQHKMAIEASIMAQFNHPNVLMLHGMTFSPTEWSVVSECPQRLTLENVLQNPANALSPLHLVHILRGVACGMRYLSDLGYVHKVLTSRTVYMSDQLVCKIGGFDLRAVLEEENSLRHVKNNINTNNYSASSEIHNYLTPWYAPEVLQAWKFSSASDVWSFGVLTWQALSYGEQPHQGRSPEEITELVMKGGQKLPLPKGCPQILYTVMVDCWKYSRQARLHFASIQSSLETIIRQPYTLDYHNSESLNGSFSSPENDSSLRKLKSMNSTTSTLTQQINANMMNSTQSLPLSDWLKKNGLSQYSELLSRSGFNHCHDLNGIDSLSLKQLGISNSKHRKKILQTFCNSSYSHNSTEVIDQQDSTWLQETNCSENFISPILSIT